MVSIISTEVVEEDRDLYGFAHADVASRMCSASKGSFQMIVVPNLANVPFLWGVVEGLVTDVADHSSLEVLFIGGGHDKPLIIQIMGNCTFLELDHIFNELADTLRAIEIVIGFIQLGEVTLDFKPH